MAEQDISLLSTPLASTPRLAHGKARSGFRRSARVEINQSWTERSGFVKVMTVVGDDVELPHEMRTRFTFVQNLFKSAYRAKLETPAKVALSELLNACFDTDSASYRSFACLLGSGCANHGAAFEGNIIVVYRDGRLDDKRDETVALSDIVFSSVRLGRLLIQEGAANIYSVVECMLVHGSSKGVILYAVFTFSLQLCLVVYMFVHLALSSISRVLLRNIPIAVLFCFFTLLVAVRQVSKFLKVLRAFWQKRGCCRLLGLMDFMCNLVIPIIIVPAGTLLLLTTEELIDSLPSSAALLFILGLHDHMLSLGGFAKPEVIREFIKADAMVQLDNFFREHTSEVGPSSERPAMKLFDVVVTPGGPSTALSVLAACEPHAVRAGDGGGEPSLYGAAYVTADTLLNKVEFRVVKLPDNARRAEPFAITHLKVWKLDGSPPLTFKPTNAVKDEDGELHVIQGCMFITHCGVGEFIYNLRICGAPTGGDLLEALDHYSLWNVAPGAALLMRRHRHPDE